MIKEFEKFFPLAPSSIFLKNSVPESIKLRQEEEAKFISSLLIKDYKGDIAKVEKAAMQIQRCFRGKQRKEEEKCLIKNFVKKSEYNKETINKIIYSKNNIYKPLCDKFFPGLANKLIEAAKQIKPFNGDLKHLTATKHLFSVLDDGFYGRQSLAKRYKDYREAALDYGDQNNGDANVVCFSFGKIDPKCKQPNTAELIIDFDQFFSDNKNNPTLFFKQQDLGYMTEYSRDVYINGKKLSFNHTVNPRNYLEGFKFSAFYYQNNGMSHYSYVSNWSLISSNLKEIYPILAMNFFRYLDSASVVDKNQDQNFIKDIYESFSKLDKSQLLSVLKNLTEKIADTMEFNAYGNIKIPIKYFKEINIFDQIMCSSYNLKMKDFVLNLKQGNLDELNKALKNIPELFKSYEVIDYLLEQIRPNNVFDIKDKLLNLRKEIELPLWKQMFEKASMKPESESYLNEAEIDNLNQSDLTGCTGLDQ